MKVGDIVIVKAWWRKDKPTRCKIEEIFTDVDAITFKPQEGDPHWRVGMKKHIIKED